MAWRPWQPGDPPRHAGGRPRRPISAEQAAHLASIAAGHIGRRNLQPALRRWHHHRTYTALYREALSRLEEQWQDDLLKVGTQADIAHYSAMLVSVGIIPRLRFLRGAIWRAKRDAERASKRRKLPTWRQVQQRVYAESEGMLSL